MKSHIGFGNLKKDISVILENINARNIFLVTSDDFYENCGAKEALREVLSRYNVVKFTDFENAKIEYVKKGLELCNSQNFDVVIAVGGGTVIDIAKLISIISAQKGELLDYVLQKKAIEVPGKPFIAVPTTAGTGSEATHFIVTYVDGIKYSVASQLILPDYSIVDSSLSMALPPKVTASTGMDAFSQAIESYWCIYSTEESKDYAAQAIKLVMGNLKKAVNNPSQKSREAMALAAHLAGKAINISKTTAPHAISYPITARFGIPHGHAVGLSLAQVLKFNYEVSDEDVLDKRGADYVRKTMKKIIELLGAKDVEDASNKINSLMKGIGLETSLGELGINNFEVIIKEGFNPERVKNNPRKLTEAELRRILTNIA